MAGEPAVDTDAIDVSRSWRSHSLQTLIVGSVLVVFAAMTIQLSFGSFSMSIFDAWAALFDPAVWTNPQVLVRFFLGEGLGNWVLGGVGLSTASVDLARPTIIVWNIRLPRVIVGIFVGATLATSGAIFQAVTRNELASPYVLGVSHGAGLAILLTLVVFSGLTGFLPLIAAAGGAIAFLTVYAIAWQGGTTPIRLVLAGIIVGVVFQSLQRGLFFFTDDIGVVQTALQWITGSLISVEWPEVRLILPWALLSLALAVVVSRQLNVLALGERTASSLGMQVEHVRFGASAIAIVAASAAIAVAGIVAFVGLIVPHIVRNIVGSDYRAIIVGCIFAGPALLVAADVGARLALAPTQVPVGVVTGLLGGPYFLYLMRRTDRLGDL